MNFDHFPQPESNDSTTVESALVALRNANDELSANDASDAFLWAVGNNHAGTFYPVVLATFQDINEILINGSPWAQRAVLEALIDLGGTFAPEPGHTTYQGKSVKHALHALIASLRPNIELLAATHDTRANSANDLLELIEDSAA